MKYIYLIESMVCSVSPDGRAKGSKYASNRVLDYRLTTKDLEDVKDEIIKGIEQDYRNAYPRSFFARRRENVIEIRNFVFSNIQLLAELPE